MKKIITALSLIILLTSTVFAAGFEKKHKYENGMFSDVPDSAWYASDVISSYEFGLVSGIGDGKFSPDGIVTVAQAVTLAARFHNNYYGTEMGPYDNIRDWYEPYFRYALENGIISEGQFDSYYRAAKRHEVAVLFASSLPKEYFKPLNAVYSIPDVSTDEEYYGDLMLLYKSGIAMGSDSAGTFNPDANITRAEFAALINRVASPGMRLAKSFDTMPKDDAYFMVDAPIMMSSDAKWPLPSGWYIDNKNVENITDGVVTAEIYDESENEYIALYRDFDVIDSGRITLNAICDICTKDNGIYVGFDNENGDFSVGIEVKNGFFNLHGKNELNTDIAVSSEYPEEYTVVLNVDLDNSLMYAYINGVLTESVPIPDNLSISRINMGSTKEGTGILVSSIVRMYHNYAVTENFMSSESMYGKSPSSFNVTGDISLQRYESWKDDVVSVKVNAKENVENVASKSFSRIYGKGIFEAFILLTESTDGAYFTLTSANANAIRIESKNGSWYSGNKKLRDFTENVWQTLRIETDTDNNTAIVKICGKTVGEFKLDAEYIDGLKIGINSNKDTVMWFDDVTAKPYIEHEDYPKAPVANNDDGYNVGIHVCSLWHDTTTYEGWQSVAPFTELEPWLGYYDEGSPELADWEIKIMAEHGIDFQHFCWYAPHAYGTTPIKKPLYVDAALNNGYFNAKYSDKVKFCIMWENNHTNNASSLNDFKETIWKYWKEYYFSDPRYEVIDNKPVLSIWIPDYFVTYFGGNDGAKEAVAFMREDIKNLGYDDLIIIIPEQYEDIGKNIGVDALFYYHYYKEGSNADFQIKSLEDDKNRDIHVIPTLAIGHNDIGRNDVRSSLVSLDGHKKVAEYIKNEYLADIKTDSWMDNTLFVSNWNEYSEGHYVSPSGEFGYGYLENVKDVFTNDKSDHSKLDVKPTDKQKERITKMFPDSHQTIRILRNEDALSNVKMKPVVSWDFGKDETYSTWNTASIEIEEITENGLKGHGTNSDPVLIARGLNIDLTYKPYIHIRMKASMTTRMSIFFGTEADNAIEGHIKTKDISIETIGEFVDYYIGMNDISAWTGTLTTLRIDPVSDTNTFEVALIELVVPDAELVTVYANGNRMSFDFLTELKDGDVEATANPRLGFFTMQNLYHVWNRFTGKLYVESKLHSLEMTVGSDKALLDGKQVDLGYTFKLRDGLPVIRLARFNELLGNKVELDGKVLTVTSAENTAESEADAQKGQYGWNFASKKDIDGWHSNTSVSVYNGNLLVSNVNSTDMQLYTSKLSLDAQKYAKLAVGLSIDPEKATGKVFQMFFTSDGESYSEAKSVAHDYDSSAMSNDKLYEFEIDLVSNKLWYGTVSELRFDIINEQVNCKVDYIRFIEGENNNAPVAVKPVKPENVPDDAILYEDYEKLSEGNTGATHVTHRYVADAAKDAFFDWATIVTYNGSKMSKKSDGYMCLATGLNLGAGKYKVSFDVIVADGSSVSLTGGVIGNETVNGSKRVTKVFVVNEGDTVTSIDFNFTQTDVYFDNVLLQCDVIQEN